MIDIKVTEREGLDSLISDYLARGGRISVIPPNVSGEDARKFNNYPKHAVNLRSMELY